MDLTVFIYFIVALIGCLLGAFFGSCIRVATVEKDKESRLHFKGQHSMLRYEEEREYRERKKQDKLNKKEEAKRMKEIEKEIEQKTSEKKENRLKDRIEIESYTELAHGEDDKSDENDSHLNKIKKKQDDKYNYILNKYDQKKKNKE